MNIIYFKSEILLQVASLGSLLSCLLFPFKVKKYYESNQFDVNLFVETGVVKKGL